MLFNRHNTLPAPLLALILTIPSLFCRSPLASSSVSNTPLNMNYGLNIAFGVAAAMSTQMILTPVTPTTTSSATISPNDPFRAVALKAPPPPEPPICCLKRSGAQWDLEEVEEEVLVSFEEWKARQAERERERMAGFGAGAGAAGGAGGASITGNGSAYVTGYGNRSTGVSSASVSGTTGAGAAGGGVVEGGMGTTQTIGDFNAHAHPPNATGVGAEAGGPLGSGDINASSPSANPDEHTNAGGSDYYYYQQELAPQFRVPLSDRFNYASLDCSARIHSAHKSAKSPSSILTPKRDRYMLSPCRSQTTKDGKLEKQFVVVELCEDIRIDTVQLANFEFFSGVFKDFEVSVAKTNLEDWTSAGRYKAKNIRGIQSFHPPTSLRDFYRYIRIDFHSHYGSEYYCPVSLLRVYGLTHLEEWKWEMWEAESRARRDEQAAQLAAAAAAASVAASYSYGYDSQASSQQPAAPGQMPTIVQGEQSPELPSPRSMVGTGDPSTGFVMVESTGLNNAPAPSGTSAIAGSGSESGSDSSSGNNGQVQSDGSTVVLTDGIFVTLAPSIPSSAPTPIGVDISPSSVHSSASSVLSSQNIQASHESNDVTSNLTNPPNAQVTTATTTATAGSEPEGDSSMKIHDSITTSTSSMSDGSSPSAHATPSIGAGPVGSPAPASSEGVVTNVVNSSNARTSTYSRVPNTSTPQQQHHPGSSSSHHSHSHPSSSSSSSAATAVSVSQQSHSSHPIHPPVPPPPSPPHPSYFPTGGESIYRTIMNRLSALETNHTLYVRYIEQQTNGVREVLKRLTEEVGRIEGFGRANSITQQRSAQEWERQKYQLQTEYRELKARVEYLADEINLEKRLSIAQLCLLAVVLVFMGLTRGSRSGGGSVQQQMQQQAQPQAQAAAGKEKEKGKKGVPLKELKGRGPRFLSFSGDWTSKSKEEEKKRKGKEVAIAPSADIGKERDTKVAFPSAEDTDQGEATDIVVDDSELQHTSDEDTTTKFGSPRVLHFQTQPHPPSHRSHRKSNSGSRSRTPTIRTPISRKTPSATLSPYARASSPRLPRSNSMQNAVFVSPVPVGYSAPSYGHHYAQYYYPVTHHGHHGHPQNYVIMSGGGPRSVKKWARTAHLHELRNTPGSSARRKAGISGGSAGSKPLRKNEQEEGDDDVFSDSIKTSTSASSLGEKENRTALGQKHHRHHQKRKKNTQSLPSPSPSLASSEGETDEGATTVMGVRWEKWSDDGQWIDTDTESGTSSESGSEQGQGAGRSGHDDDICVDE